MNKVLVVLTIIVLTSCTNNKGATTEVKNNGALRQIMSGNLEATASLDSLQQLPHLYALGALENLEGEIQIFDGDSYVSKSGEDRSVIIESNFDHKASLLVYTQVTEWSDGMELDSFENMAHLEKQIKEIAIQQGVDVGKPFPFLLKGTISSLNWHVIQWPAGDTDHTHKKHQESGAHGLLEQEEVEVIGFYSEKHKAVFTHHTTFLHMHFKTVNEKPIAGHVDRITSDELELYLPI